MANPEWTEPEDWGFSCGDLVEQCDRNAAIDLWRLFHGRNPHPQDGVAAKYIATCAVAFAKHRLAALEASSRQEERLREALAKRDKLAGECPDSKLDPDKPCPRCKAESNEGCRITVWADATFVQEARAALSPPHAKDAADV